jgi:hypothetical protein
MHLTNVFSSAERNLGTLQMFFARPSEILSTEQMFLLVQVKFQAPYKYFLLA